MMFENVDFINAYLAKGKNIIIEDRPKPLSPLLSRMFWGNKATDDGHLMLNEWEKDDLIGRYPGVERFIRPCIGGKELIYSIPRYCLWLEGVSERELEEMPLVRARVEAVRQFRLASKAESTRHDAGTPTLFQEIREGTRDRLPFLAIPLTSSGGREYIPMAYLDGDVVANAGLQIIFNAPVWLFGLLTSRMHMAWIGTVAGRLETRYRYSNSLVYNNFPVPDLTDAQKTDLSGLADEVLTIRMNHPDKTLFSMYNITTMPCDLRNVHHNIDGYVDKLYNTKGFTDDSDRFAHLCCMYAESCKS